MTAATTQDFVNGAYIGTFAGATFGITIICLFVRKLLKINSAWTPAILSIVFNIAIVATKGWPESALDWLAALVNVALLFFAVIGANETATELVTAVPAGQGKPHGKRDHNWLESFFNS